MEYVISNFTKIGIKDIQIIFIENIIEKSIYGIYCLVLYLIKKIIEKTKNDEYSQLRATTKQKKPYGPRKRLGDVRTPEWKAYHSAARSAPAASVPPQMEEAQPVHSWTYVSLCTFTIVYGISILYYIYIRI